MGINRGIPNFEVKSDKWAQSIYWIIDLGINCPWLAGIWAILFMAVAVYCIVDILEIKSRISIFLVAGICATNIAVIAQQTYTGQNFYGLIALAEACLSVWVLKKNEMLPWLKWLISAIFIILSAATYGAYVGVVPALMICIIVKDIISGCDAKSNYILTLKFVIHFLLSMVLYYAILRFILFMQGSELQAYMGEDNLSSVSGIRTMILSIPDALERLGAYYWQGDGYLPVFLGKTQRVILLLGGMEAVLIVLLKWKYITCKFRNVFLGICAMCILPLCLNMIYILSSGHVHSLMIFSYCLPLVFA